jgi:SNF2 family DNA or RNA helicase
VDSSVIPSLADGVRLRDFQLDDAERVLLGWMALDSAPQKKSTSTKRKKATTKGVVLAHEMGLGKTLIAMSALSMDMYSLRKSLSALAKPPKIQALIVLPNSVLWNWNSELDKFFPKTKLGCPFKRVLVYHRTNTDVTLPKTAQELEEYDVVLTTFGTYESRFNLFSSLSWEYLCVDEAHHLRTQTTKGFQLISSLECNKCLLLTGTPISNKVSL